MYIAHNWLGIIFTDYTLLVQGQECSNFLAGQALRSTNRFSALHETGVRVLFVVMSFQLISSIYVMVKGNIVHCMNTVLLLITCNILTELPTVCIC